MDGQERSYESAAARLAQALSALNEAARTARSALKAQAETEQQRDAAHAQAAQLQRQLAEATKALRERDKLIDQLRHEQADQSRRLGALMAETGALKRTQAVTGERLDAAIAELTDLVEQEE